MALESKSRGLGDRIRTGEKSRLRRRRPRRGQWNVTVAPFFWSYNPEKNWPLQQRNVEPGLVAQMCALGALSTAPWTSCGRSPKHLHFLLNRWHLGSAFPVGLYGLRISEKSLRYTRLWLLTAVSQHGNAVDANPLTSDLSQIP
ncbi:hypothetical protein SKAU_G00185190 [Synaphobranchus kaupii]|uniref:Uncharacterized protein n=1 Tax=Synaphobranchus kaupii TaxID=118154 RepID=A0A9Q1FCE2_SYNKA|nr:hypothetical protein SKAU_G00185190 [Synaphobranchus kaupii]